MIRLQDSCINTGKDVARYVFCLNIFNSGIEYTEKGWVRLKVRHYPLPLFLTWEVVIKCKIYIKFHTFECGRLLAHILNYSYRFIWGKNILPMIHFCLGQTVSVLDYYQISSMNDQPHIGGVI